MHFATCALDPRQLVDEHAELRAQQVDVDARFGQQAAHGAALLVEQCDHDVGRFDELVILANGQRLRIRKRHLELAGQFIHSHGLPLEPQAPKLFTAPEIAVFSAFSTLRPL